MRVFAFLVLLFAAWSSASAATLEEVMARLPAGDFDDRAAVVSDIGLLGDARATPLLAALGEGSSTRASRTAASSG